MKKIYIMIIISACIFITYLIFQNYLPPRTPRKIVKLTSGLNIPYNVKIIKFDEEWGDFFGDGYSYIVMQFNNKEFIKILNNAVAEKYKSLPLPVSLHPFRYSLKIYKKHNGGLYKIEFDQSDNRNFSLTILDADKKQIIVAINIM